MSGTAELALAKGSRIVARVADRCIRAADVAARIAAIRGGPYGPRLPQPGTPEDRRLRRWVVQVLVSEAIVAHEAPRCGFPAYRGVHAHTAIADRPTSFAPANIEHAQPDSVADVANGASPAWAGWLTAAVSHLFDVVTANVAVDEATIRRYYEGNRDRYHRRELRRIRHVLTHDEDTAARVRERVAAGDDLATLAGTHSEDRGTSQRGGDLGEVRRGVLTGPLEDVAFSADAGQVLGPVRTEFGWHVLRVERIRPAATAPYEQVREAIRGDLLAAERGRTFDRWFETRRRELATIEPAWNHPGDPGLPDSVHRH